MTTRRNFLKGAAATGIAMKMTAMTMAVMTDNRCRGGRLRSLRTVARWRCDGGDRDGRRNLRLLVLAASE